MPEDTEPVSRHTEKSTLFWNAYIVPNFHHEARINHVNGEVYGNGENGGGMVHRTFPMLEISPLLEWGMERVYDGLSNDYGLTGSIDSGW
jgi:hypothetical protein